MKFIVRRYELILVILILVLTGSISITSNEIKLVFPDDNRRFPYTVALTFDDGPYPGSTEKLLDILDKERVVVTFFVVGKKVSEFPELLNLIKKHGHEIGNHTYNHYDMTKLNEDNILNELETTRYTIKTVCGIDTYLFRPPGGQINRQVKNLVQKYGYKSIMWTVLPKDHETWITKEKIIETIMSNVSDKGIVLLHLGQEHTMSALPEIIAKLRVQGYKFVTISQLLCG
jgi:peptidoglycan/xylan/chitin deacetylase (PgdA/CDA1 family)